MFNTRKLTIQYTDDTERELELYPPDMVYKLNELNDEVDKLLRDIANKRPVRPNITIINEITGELERLKNMVVVKNINSSSPPSTYVPPPTPVVESAPPVVIKNVSPNTMSIDTFMTNISNSVIAENYLWLVKISAFQPKYITDNLSKSISINADEISNLQLLLFNKEVLISSDNVVNLTGNKLVSDNSQYENRPEDTSFIDLFNKIIRILSDNNVTSVLKSAYFDMLGLGGVIVKYFDASDAILPQEIFVSNSTSVFVKQQPDGSVCANAIRNEDSKLYGPFKRVFGPKGDESSNKAFYDFLITGYGMLDDIAKGKDFRLYAFGFSGSGKTYTFITGDRSDPPVLVHLIANIKNGSLKANGVPLRFEGSADGNGDNDGLSYQAFYPLEHNNLPSIDKFNKVSKPVGLKLPSGSSLEDMTVELQKELIKVDDDLRNKLYVVPTTNNPNSSRAFTLYKIKFHVGSEQRTIIFTDMPGNEKTTLIKTDFLFTPDVLKKQKEILEDRYRTINSVNKKAEFDSRKFASLPGVANIEKVYNRLADKNGKIYIHHKVDPGVYNSLGLPDKDGGIEFSSDAFDSTGKLKKHIKIMLGFMFKNLYIQLININRNDQNVKVGGLYNLTILGNLEDSTTDTKETVWGMWLVDTMIEFILFYNMKSKLESGTVYILPLRSEFMMGNPASDTPGFCFLRDFSRALQNKLLKTLELKPEKMSDSSIPEVKYDASVIDNVIDKVFDPSDEIYRKTDGSDFDTRRNRLFKSGLGAELAKVKFTTLRNTLTKQFNVGVEVPPNATNVIGNMNIKNIKNFGSPIIYTLLALSTKLVMPTTDGKTDQGDSEGLWNLNENIHQLRSFVLSLLCFRVILYILKQGNAINTALENHKFYFLKLAGNFGPSYRGTLMGGRMKDENEGENFVINEEEENKVMWNTTPSPTDRINLRPINKALQFKNDTYKIQVSTSAPDKDGNIIYFEEIIRRKYMPIFNQILYTGPIAPSDIYSTDQSSAEKALTLVAIKRKLGESAKIQQGARCKFAIESLRFAEQISNEPKPSSSLIPNMSNYSSLGYNKKYYDKYLKYKNKYLQLKK